MEDNLDFYIGTFHPILVHFPIVLFTLTLICDLFYGIGETNAFSAGHWMLFGGTLMCIPTIATGWEASQSFPPDDPTVHKHMLMAFTTASYAVLYSCFRLATIFKKWEMMPLIFVTLSVILVLLTSWTADYGGLLSHGVTPFGEIKS